jgi:hypothetical protein
MAKSSESLADCTIAGVAPADDLTYLIWMARLSFAVLWVIGCGSDDIAASSASSVAGGDNQAGSSSIGATTTSGSSGRHGGGATQHLQGGQFSGGTTSTVVVGVGGTTRGSAGGFTINTSTGQGGGSVRTSSSGGNGTAGDSCYTTLPAPHCCWVITGHFRDAGLSSNPQGGCSNFGGGRWFSCLSVPVGLDLVGEYQATDVRDSTIIVDCVYGCELCPQPDGTMGKHTVSDQQ